MRCKGHLRVSSLLQSYRGLRQVGFRRCGIYFRDFVAIATMGDYETQQTSPDEITLESFAQRFVPLFHRSHILVNGIHNPFMDSSRASTW